MSHGIYDYDRLVGNNCRTNFKGLDFICSLEICIKGSLMVDIIVLAKMMRLVLMLLLLTICQPPPILKNVLRIHELKILLVLLSSKAFLINYLANFQPLLETCHLIVTCIVGAQEHKITSYASISITIPKFHIL
jgi:hypothetical protein